MEASAIKEEIRLKFYLDTLSDRLEATQRFLEKYSGDLPIGIEFWGPFFGATWTLEHKCNFALRVVQEAIAEHTGEHTDPNDAESPDS